jgi:hypothetical protein
MFFFPFTLSVIEAPFQPLGRPWIDQRDVTHTGLIQDRAQWQASTLATSDSERALFSTFLWTAEQGLLLTKMYRNAPW